MRGFFIVLLLAFNSNFCFSSPDRSPTPRKGLLDLSGYIFSNNEVSLDGEWEFYWKELKTDDFSVSPQYFLFPKLWNQETVGGQLLSPQGYATYRLRILMPQQYTEMAMTIPDVYTSYNLFIDGNLIANNGTPGSSKGTTSPHWLPQTIPLRDLGDTVELVLQISNFHHSKGGAKESIIIGDYDKLISDRESEFALDLILTGSLIMGGLFFLGLYLFGKHDLSMLFFALFCLVYSYRIFGFGIYTFHSLCPNIDWIITTRLEYATLFLSVLLFGFYILALYPKEVNKTLVNILTVISVAFLAASALFPSLWFTLLVEPYFIILLVYITYAIYVYILAAIHKRDGAKYALASTGIVFLVFAYNMLAYFGITPEQRLFSFFGYIAFFFLQSLILSFRFAASLKTAITKAEKAVLAKSEFLSMMSHEIRTPMNGVIGLTNFLIEDNPRDDQKESLTTLKFSAENLLVIINDILDYNKIDVGKVAFSRTSLNLKELIHQIEKANSPGAVEKRISFSTIIDPELPEYIICDPTRTSQVLMNLVGNAIKFTKEGSVKLVLENVKNTEKQVTVRFTVEDTGIGIQKNKLDMIFDRFTQASATTTREFGGTGLGLAICKKLLGLQEVDLCVESEFGKGSKFFFEQTFEKSSSKALKEQKQPIDEILKLNDIKILLVEDSEVNVFVASKFLKKWGIEVDHAGNGREAIEKLRNKEYNLILMDIQMPIMDGYEAVEEIRKMGITTPVIALTASAMLDVQEKIFDVGMDGFVMKPFNPEELFKEISAKVSQN